MVPSVSAVMVVPSGLTTPSAVLVAFFRPMVVFSVPWNSMPSGMALSPSLNDRARCSPLRVTTGNEREFV